jgi:maleate isomerase
VGESVAGEKRGFEESFEKGYGWRARIGHLNPALIEETVAKQFYRMAPDGVTLVQTSLRVESVTREGILAAIGRAEEAAIELAKELPNCIIIGGSPVAVIGGPGSDTPLVERIGQLTGIPTTSSQAAAIEAMRLLGMERVVVVAPTPFTEDWRIRVAEYLGSADIEVLRIVSVGEGERGHLGLVEQRAPKEIYELALRVFGEADGADGIYFPGAPSPSVDVIQPLESELGTKVVASLQATLWKGMRMAGVDVTVDGYGELLHR